MALGKRRSRSFRSPTLKPRLKNPRKPAVHGADEAWEMQGWETDWSQSAIRIIGPNQPITDPIIDEIDHFLGAHSSTMNRSGVRGDSPFSGTLCRAVDLLKCLKPVAA